MNITQYNKKRDELSFLLQDVINCLEKIDSQYEKLDMSSLKKTKEEIAAIRKKVYEDIYKIVLVAKFQGGKSTSFNAITGGSCISPMGNGAIKCSAAPVMAKSVLSSADAKVTVYMRNKTELSELLSAGGFDDVDLDSIESVEYAKTEWQEKFIIWQDNRDLFKDDGERDMFFVSGFILEYFMHPTIQEYVKKQSFEVSIGDIGQFAKFPDGYMLKYSHNGPRAFTVEEALYAFVCKVDAHVQSQEMSKIGASFVDAPGLFANAYDTNVTRAELSDASAVWYLLGGTAPGSEELRAIKECYELSNGRLFISANFKGNRVALPVWLKDSLPSIEAVVNGIIKNVKIQPYHALLALLYTQGEYFVTNGKWLDDSIKEFLIKQCEDLGIPNPDAWPSEKCWKKLVKVCINQMYPAGLDEFDDLSDSLSTEGTAIIRRECNWDGTVEAIREFVVNSKSKSILITDTSQKALALIHDLKKLLKRREDDANRSFEESYADYISAERKLNEFMEFCKGSIEEQFEGDSGVHIDSKLAMDVYDYVYEKSIPEITDLAAPLIAKKVNFFRIVGSKVVEWGRKGGRFIANLWRKCRGELPNTTPIQNAFGVEVNLIMGNTMKDVLGGRMTRWLNQTKEGKNSTVKNEIIYPARRAYDRLALEWKERCGSDKILASLVPALPELPVSLGRGRFDHPDLMACLTKLSFSEFIKDIVASCVGLYFVGLSVPEPFSVFMSFLLGVLFVILRRAFSDENAMTQKIKDKMDAAITVNFSKNKRDVISKIISPLSVFRKSVIQVLKKPFNEVKMKFQKAWEGALSDYMRDSIHREQVARECKEIRETHIEGEQGLEQRLINYIVETEPLCAEDSCSNTAQPETEY